MEDSPMVEVETRERLRKIIGQTIKRDLEVSDLFLDLIQEFMALIN